MSGAASDAPAPEFRRGWSLVLAACVGVVCSSIVLPYYTIGPLVVPVTEAFGWTRAEFQAAILFSSGLGALTAPVVGWLIHRYGARRVALPGLVGLALGFMVAATMNGELWVLYLAYGTMALLGAGTIPVTWTTAITQSFFRRRGLALGLTLTGTGVCAALAPFYTSWLVVEFGWRVAYAGLGLLPLLLAGPIVFVGFRVRGFRVREQAGADPAPDPLERERRVGLTLAEAARVHRFWILLLSILCAYMGFSGIGTNLYPSMIDRGMDEDQASTVQSAFGIAIIVGRVVVGGLVDRFWAPGVAAVSLALPVGGALLFTTDPGFALAICGALLIGFAAGAELDLMSFLAARYFGLAHYAKIYSILYAALAVCSGTAPMLFARVHDSTGSYDLGFTAAAVLFALAVGLVLTLGRYPEHEEQDP